MNDHNRDNLALQKRIGELEFTLIQRDDQVRELQYQLAEARQKIRRLIEMGLHNEPHA